MIKQVIEEVEAHARTGTVPAVDMVFLLLRVDVAILQKSWFRNALDKVTKRICSRPIELFSKRKRLLCINDLKGARNNTQGRTILVFLSQKIEEIEKSIQTSAKLKLKNCSTEEDVAEPPRKKRRSCHGDTFVSLSKSLVWNRSASFYKREGMQAWDKGTVPYIISSSNFIARSYADRIDQFYRQFVNSRTQPMYVFELGGGHMKLGYLVIRCLLKTYSLDKFPFKFILCDICEDVVVNRSTAKVFEEYVGLGIVDFSCWDCLSTDMTGLKLVSSGEMLELKSISSGLAVLSNYFFDSLPTDVYVWGAADTNPLEILVSEARVSTSRTSTVRHFDSRISNTSLLNYIKSHQLPGRFFSVPVGAVQCIANIKRFLRTIDVPLLWQYGDKVHSSLDDTILRVNKREFLPSLVRHGKNGCISVTIDNEMIGQTILDGMPVKHTSHFGSTDAFQVSVVCNRPFAACKPKVSVSDWEALSQFFCDDCSPGLGEMIEYLEASNYDFLKFEEIMWEMAECIDSASPEDYKKCICTGMLCYRSQYSMSMEASLNACIIFARWLYVLRTPANLMTGVLHDIRNSHGVLDEKQERSMSKLERRVRSDKYIELHSLPSSLLHLK